jgi:hypothetical protein
VVNWFWDLMFVALLQPLKYLIVTTNLGNGQVICFAAFSHQLWIRKALGDILLVLSEFTIDSLRDFVGCSSFSSFSLALFTYSEVKLDRNVIIKFLVKTLGMCLLLWVQGSDGAFFYIILVNSCRALVTTSGCQS